MNVRGGPSAPSLSGHSLGVCARAHVRGAGAKALRPLQAGVLVRVARRASKACRGGVVGWGGAVWGALLAWLRAGCHAGLELLMRWTASAMSHPPPMAEKNGQHAQSLPPRPFCDAGRRRRSGARSRRGSSMINSFLGVERGAGRGTAGTAWEERGPRAAPRSPEGRQVGPGRPCSALFGGAARRGVAWGSLRGSPDRSSPRHP